MSEKIKLGVLPEAADIGHRDAVHVPCVCVQAAARIRPGDDVKFVDEDLTTAVVSRVKKERDGVADPFLYLDTYLLEGMIQPGEAFWMLLRPGLVTNIRHEFDLDESQVESHDDDCYRDC